MGNPESYSLQVNLSAKRKLAAQLEERLADIAEGSGVDLCDYRLVPRDNDRLVLIHISNSLLQYQLTFSQIYDAVRNGRKQRTVISDEVARDSQLQVGYTYSGSFGVVLLAPGKRDFFEGAYDKSIEALCQLLNISDSNEVRDIARHFGDAVIKRLHDWSAANVAGRFDVDVHWKRSDGNTFGRLVQFKEMRNFVDLIEAASEESDQYINVRGTLVGIDMKADHFHFVVPDGLSYRGRLHDDFQRGLVQVPQTYSATLLERLVTQYATGREVRHYELVHLDHN